MIVGWCATNEIGKINFKENNVFKDNSSSQYIQVEITTVTQKRNLGGYTKCRLLILWYNNKRIGTLPLLGYSYKTKNQNSSQL